MENDKLREAARAAAIEVSPHPTWFPESSDPEYRYENQIARKTAIIVRHIAPLVAQQQPEQAGAGWIPVEERLPDKRERVLVWDGDAEIVEFAGDRWIGDSGSCPLDQPTHWQPLPPHTEHAPKETP